MRAAAVVVLFALAAATCSEPASPRARAAHLALRPVLAAHSSLAAATAPINDIVVAVHERGSGASLGVLDRAVDPNATAWDFAFDVVITGRDPRELVATVELLHTAPDTLSVEYSGLAIFTATAGQTVDVPITLYPGPLAPAASLDVSPQQASVAVGGSVTLTADVRDSAQNHLTRLVAWRSSDTSIATVSTSGVVNGRKAGSARVVASLEGLADTASIDVYVPVLSALVQVSGNSQQGVVYGALPLDLVVAAQDQNSQPVAGVSVTWHVTDAIGGSVAPDSVVTGDDGLAHTTFTLGASTGTYTVNAVAAGTQLPPVVFTATAKAQPPIDSIVVAPKQDTLTAGDTAQFAATAYDSSSNVVVHPLLTWRSSDSLVARVDTGGRVVAGAAGDAWIFAASGTVRDSARVHVVAGAATALVAYFGNGQSAFVGDTLADSIVVMAIDRVGNGVSGVKVTWSVVTGGGALSATQGVTNARGLASAQWTLGPTAGQQVAQAASAGLANSPVQFNATAASGAMTRTWVGGAAAGPDDWSVAANWSPLGVPTALDTVVVSTSANPPRAYANVSVGPLTVTSGAVVRTGGYVITVTGNLLVDGAITDNGSVHLLGSNVTLHGAVSNLDIDATVTANGPVVASGSLYIVSGNLRVNGQSVTVGGDFKAGAISGTIQMVDPSDVLEVQGSTTFANTNETGLLTAGTIVALGDFVTACYNTTEFVSQGTQVIMAGSGTPQRIGGCFGANASRFQDLVVASGASVVTGDNPIVVANTLTLDGTFTVEVNGLVDVKGPAGSLVLDSTGVLVNNGTVKANLPITNNGGTLTGNPVVQR